MGVVGRRGSLDRTRRLALLVLGWACVVLAAAGVVLPLMPTVPFLLVAAACFGKASPRAARWLITNRLFGRYLREYQEGRRASRGTKAVSLVTLWLGLLAGAYLARPPVVIVLTLAVVGVAVSAYVLSLSGKDVHHDRPA